MIKRIQKELKELAESDPELKKQLWVQSKGDSMTEFTGFVKGASGTPYENGTFQIEIIIPDNYPFSPPKARFITNIWHPNISSVTGCICMDILKDAWTPSYTMKAVLLSIQSLLLNPEPNDPQDAAPARQMKRAKKKFHSTAQFWTLVHAQGLSSQEVLANEELSKELEDLRTQVVAVMDMKGMTFHQALVHCSTNNWRKEPGLKVARTPRNRTRVL